MTGKFRQSPVVCTAMAIGNDLTDLLTLFGIPGQKMLPARPMMDPQYRMMQNQLQPTQCSMPQVVNGQMHTRDLLLQASQRASYLSRSQRDQDPLFGWKCQCLGTLFDTRP